MSSFSTASFLQSNGPATFTRNLNVQSMKITHVLLTPYLLAPEENIELVLRNYWNFGGLSISNATGQVYFPKGLTTGLAAIYENNVPARHLAFEHDIGMNFRCGTTYVLSLEAANGATVSALSVSGNCNVAGQLVVNGVNILDQVTNAAASTATIGISDFTGLTERRSAR